MGNHFKCCMNCQERHVGCHKDCPAYLTQKEKFYKEKETVEKNRNELIEHYCRRIGQPKRISIYYQVAKRSK